MAGWSDPAAMIVEDQSEVVAFLSEPGAYGEGDVAIARNETHGAIVFLVGERAYKLKRAVRFDYMDYGTAERRRAMCEAEVRINSRTAPDIYRRVVSVTRTAEGGLEIDGVGPAVDWLVEMNRFDEDTLFDRLAARGALDEILIVDLIAALATFHRAAERRPDAFRAIDFRRELEGNATELKRYVPAIFDRAAVERLDRESLSAAAHHAPVMEKRRNLGYVRHCHGDLHLKNVCLVGGRPRLFDAIEFSDRFANIDVLYDLAFLLMDLIHHDLSRLACVALNQYLWRGNGIAGLSLLPIFLSCAAAIRAHVGAATAETTADAPASEAVRGEARQFLSHALGFLDPAPPRLVAVGGLSGSGKTTLAMGLAPAFGAAPGALVVRSDVVRKRLLGVDPSEGLPAEAYAPRISTLVYQTIQDQAAIALGAGHAVIVDAVYARQGEREGIEAVARRLGVPFDGLWLEVPREVMVRRIEGRRGDASDATVAVLDEQLGYDVSTVAWAQVSGGGTHKAVQAAARRALMRPPPRDAAVE